MEKVHFLGHVISKEYLWIQLRLKLLLIAQDLQILLKYDLGMVGYYRRFIEGLSKLALPLTKLLRKDNKFV